MKDNVIGILCLVVFGLFIWLGFIAPGKKYDALDPSQYDIVNESEIESYVNEGKVYSVIDVRIAKARRYTMISVVLEDDTGKRYTQNFTNLLSDDLSYKSLTTLASGDKVVVLNIDESWDVDNLRRIRETNEEK